MIDAHARLLRLVERLARSAAATLPSPQPAVAVDSIESVPWASATFSGQRHRLDLSVVDGTGDRTPALLDALAVNLREPDMKIPGHVLVDLSFVEAVTRHVEGGCAIHISLEALTVED